MNIETVKKIDEGFQTAFDGIVLEANAMKNVFWSHRNNMLEKHVDSLTPTLGCRVSVVDGAVRMNWFYWRFYKTGGKTRRTNVHISKNKRTNSFSLKKLQKHALPNEYGVIEMVEGKFTELRVRAEALRKCKQSFYYLKKATLGDRFEEYEIARKANIEIDNVKPLEELGEYGESN